MDEKEIFSRLNGVDDIPTLPSIAIEVNNLLSDDSVSVDSLCRVIENDQAIVSKILRLVNSAFFGVSSKVSSVYHAIIFLGFNAIRSAVLSISVFGSFKLKNKPDGFDIADFWRHSIAVAVISRYLAIEASLEEPDEYFIAGLLHDIGKIILAQYFPELFKEVTDTKESKRISFYESEKMMIPVDHTRLGEYVATRWKLPHRLVQAIRYHHTPNQEGFDREFLNTIYMADAIANRYRLDEECKLDILSTERSLKGVVSGPVVDSLKDWIPAALNDIELACNFFAEK